MLIIFWYFWGWVCLVAAQVHSQDGRWDTSVGRYCKQLELAAVTKYKYKTRVLCSKFLCP
jgi:hypothetical protein